MTINTTAPASPAIRIRGAGKVFSAAGGDVTALTGIDLDIAEGAFVCLLGPSGCGKSTLLRLIGDLDQPTSGTVEVHGRSAAEARQARDYGMVFQQPGLMDWRSVRNNIELPLQVQGVNRTERRRIAGEMLELVRLEDFGDHRPAQLSGGMQQRAAIARALSFAPRLLLMDEPLSALDEMNREYMQGELRRIWQSTSTTVVSVTHSIPEAVFLSTEVVIMSPLPGRIAERIPVDLPEQRTAETRTSDHFYEIETRVRKALHGVLEDAIRSAA
ncbi:ABC transporter ATP-binding protein [Arthrobacter sp. FW306-04-A]|uniref:ABC transporter ATP-binding protein n=1 Tax=Arthrobacter sp. FW306-04-A TaxID=2879619 RepID=UPI0037C14C75|nr:ABC transporter ATP-binding protein [Arthrobacter sp. FW306-04-A]